jgi:hypothetical protein
MAPSSVPQQCRKANAEARHQRRALLLLAGTGLPERGLHVAEDDDRAAGLVDWLQEQGYTRTAEVADVRPSGNRVTRMVRGACQVTVSRDRGQWYVDVGPLDVDGFDMNLWEAYLRDVQPAIEPTPFLDDDRLLRNVLHEIERTLVLDDTAVRRLETLRTWRHEARWSSPQAY